MNKEEFRFYVPERLKWTCDLSKAKPVKLDKTKKPYRLIWSEDYEISNDQ
jgi:hypothetical protein